MTDWLTDWLTDLAKIRLGDAEVAVEEPPHKPTHHSHCEASAEPKERDWHQSTWDVGMAWYDMEWLCNI